MTLSVTERLRGRHLASDGRAGTYPRALARRRQREFLSRHRLSIVVAWLLMVSPAAIGWWLLPSDVLRGAVAGGLLVGVTSALWFLVVQSTGTAPTMMGGQGEQWTAGELRRLPSSWRLINHFFLSDREIDHLAVGPAGVLVVETKWTAHDWASPESAATLHRAVQSVRSSARQVQLWHAVKSSRLSVRPLVVLWGGATRAWPESQRVREVDGVTVVTGGALRGWLSSSLVESGADKRAIDAVWHAVDEQSRKKEEKFPDQFAVPVALEAALGRLAAFVMGAVAAVVAIGQALSSGGSAAGAVFAGVAVAAVASAARRAPRQWWALHLAARGCWWGAVAGILLIAGGVAATWLNH